MKLKKSFVGPRQRGVLGWPYPSLVTAMYLCNVNATSTQQTLLISNF